MNPTKKPHIVFITADQMRWDCLSAYGNLGVRTPHLDALGNESVVFNNAYCATPLCVPTRTCIGSGRWPQSTRAVINANANYPKERVWGELGPEYPTFYEHLDQAGYGITHVGIQHIHSLPPLRSRVPRADIVEAKDHENYLESLGHESIFKPSRRMPVLDFNNGKWIVKQNWICADAVEPYPHALETFKDPWFAGQMEERIQSADPNNPQAFVFQCWAPHPPIVAPEPYFSMYRPEDIELPENVGRWYEGMPPTLLLGTGPQRCAHMQREDWKKIWAVYFGLVTMVDECIGRVIRALKENGFWDDALVVFTMDHGEAIGSHRMFEKMTAYEESAHIPLFIKPPGGATGRRGEFVNHVDLAPTLCDYAGAEPIPAADGRSLRPLVDGTSDPSRDATYVVFNGDQARAFPTRAIITDPYKYIHHFCDDPELYNLREDPRETRNLAAQPEYQDVVRRLKDRLADWMREANDFLDIDKHVGFQPADWARFQKEP